MGASYIAYHPEQQQLLPSALQVWLAQGHLAYFISDIVEPIHCQIHLGQSDRGGGFFLPVKRDAFHGVQTFILDDATRFHKHAT